MPRLPGRKLANRAVFLDRDGVLIRDVHLLTRPEQIDMYPYVPAATEMLHEAGYLTVVVTNQPVVARGHASEEEVDRVHAGIQQALRASADCQVDRFYFCPHHPNADLPKYRVACNCRKPRAGMLLRAADEMSIDLTQSWMIGDRPTDVQAGHRSGCRTVLVETGMHDAPPIGTGEAQTEWVAEDLRCPDLMAAAVAILEADEKCAR